MKDATRYRSNP